MQQTVRRILTGKIVLIPLGLICLYSLIGWMITPWAIQQYAPPFLNQKFHQQLSLGKVRIDPYALTLTIDDILIGTPEAPLVSCRKLFIDFDITRAPGRGAAFGKILLDTPAVHLTIDPDGRTNLEKAFAAPSSSETADSLPSRIWIENVQISRGAFDYTDRHHPQPVHLTLQDIDATIANLTTLPEQTGEYDISARTPDGETLACQGKLSLEPFNVRGSMALKNVLVKTLRSFMAEYLVLESAEGKCSLETDYVLHSTDKGIQLQLDKLHLETLDLSLKAPRSDKAFLALKKLLFDRMRFDLKERDVQIGQVLMADGWIDVHVDENGHVDLAQILRSDTGEKQNAAETAPAAGDKGSSHPPWKAVADSIIIRNIAFTLDDFSRITPIQLKISGIGMGFSARYHADPSSPKFLVENFSCRLQDIGIHRSGDNRPVFANRQLDIEEGTVDIDGQTVSVSRIALQDGHIDVLRDSSGQINWQHLFTPAQTPHETTQQTPETASATDWNYRVHSFEMNGFGVDISDAGTVADSPILTVESFSGKLSDIDGKSPMGFEAGFSLKQGGMATFRGRVDPVIPTVAADIQCNALSLKPLQPYLDLYARLAVQSAELSLQGNFQWGLNAPHPGPSHKAEGDNETKTPHAAMSYTGSARLDKLNLTEKHSPKTLVGCDRFDIPKCRMTLDPNRLDIDRIYITKPTGELIIAPDHSLNLSKVIISSREKSSHKKSPQTHHPLAEQKTFPVHIGQIDVRKGDILFADLSLEPQFMTRITHLEGLIRGLSSVGDTPSPVRLDGRVEPYGMARVNGRIDFFHPERSTDLSLVFKNVEMTKLTPYSGKFAGRRITSGKLSLDLKYRVENHRLVGDNQIIVDNLALGEHVDSPTAVNLPLDLAVALLKDSNGRIQIGLPVSGDLNNPQFSYGDLLWKAFSNVLTQLVTSPFRALKSLFGGGHELDDHVIFEPGESVVSPPEKEKLAHLADMLKQRPQLKLTVQGQFSPEADSAAMKEKKVRRSVLDHTRKFSDGENEALVGLDFTDSPTQVALEKLFTEKAGRPAFDELKRTATTHTSNQADIPRILSETLYTRLLEMEPISSEKLVQLAEDRSRQIFHEMETVGGIHKDQLASKSPEAQTSAPPSAALSLDARVLSPAP